MPHAHDDNSAYVGLQKLQALQRALVEHSERLTRFTPKGTIRVKLDSHDVASFNFDETNCVQFTIDNEEAELIEIVSEEEQLVLAVHVLDDEVWQSPERMHTYLVRHASGSRIIFNIIRIENAGGGHDQLSVVVTYKKARFERAFVVLMHRIESGFSRLKMAAPNWVEQLLPSRLRAPVLAADRSSRLVLIALAMVTLVPLVLFLLLGPLSFRRNAATIREANANSTALQVRPPAIEQTETRSTTAPPINSESCGR